MNFEEFRAAAQTASPSEILQRLSSTLELDQQYGAWFEALKLQTRFELGLEPWNVGVPETLPADIQRQLEERLLDACRAVGERLIMAGRITEGWMYLRPVGDTARVVELLRELAPREEHADQIIEVTLGHGVAPAWGFELLLGRMGTCNAITAFDTQMIHASLPERQQAAELLVRHVYAELLKSVRQCGLKHWAEGQRDAHAAAEWDLQQWVENVPDLTANQNYHTDPSHLSSVVRIGRIVDERSVQTLAWQLCCYGKQLDELFQPQGYEVFHPYYETHQSYYAAVLAEGNSVGDLDFFRRRRAELTEAAEQPTAMTWEGQMEATDVLVELLMRRRQYSSAVEVLMDQLRICDEHQRSRWTSLLFRCCQLGDGFEPMLRYSQRLGDVFGFGLATFYQRYETDRK